MENLNIIVTTAIPAFGLLITTITFLTKFIIAVKQKNIAHAKSLLTDFAQLAVQEVEILKGKSNGELTGETKLTIALNKIEAACVKAKIIYDEIKATALIEELVTFTKTVNSRDKDKTAI